MTFESGQVRPLALSPDAKMLVAANTPDGQLEVFNVGNGGISHAASIPVGLEPVAVAFNGYFNGVVEGMWAGGTPAARGLQANYALYWDMMKDACERGMRRYHLGRSTAESGAEDFKKRWNAEPSQLYWYFHRPKGGEMPQLNVDNPKYKLAIQAWRKLPLWVTRKIGPPLARSIP